MVTKKTQEKWDNADKKAKKAISRKPLKMKDIKEYDSAVRLRRSAFRESQIEYEWDRQGQKFKKKKNYLGNNSYKKKKKKSAKDKLREAL